MRFELKSLFQVSLGGDLLTIFLGGCFGGFILCLFLGLFNLGFGYFLSNYAIGGIIVFWDVTGCTFNNARILAFPAPSLKGDLFFLAFGGLKIASSGF